MGEADMGVYNFLCSHERNKVIHCLPAVNYKPMYFYTRYPLETTKLWNLLKLLSPTSWACTFLSIIAVVIIMKIITFIGVQLGGRASFEDVTLVPVRFNKSYTKHCTTIHSKG